MIPNEDIKLSLKEITAKIIKTIPEKQIDNKLIYIANKILQNNNIESDTDYNSLLRIFSITITNEKIEPELQLPLNVVTSRIITNVVQDSNPQLISAEEKILQTFRDNKLPITQISSIETAVAPPQSNISCVSNNKASGESRHLSTRKPKPVNSNKSKISLTESIRKKVEFIQPHYELFNSKEKKDVEAREKIAIEVGVCYEKVITLRRNFLASNGILYEHKEDWSAEDDKKLLCEYKKLKKAKNKPIYGILATIFETYPLCIEYRHRELKTITSISNNTHLRKK